ncbi:hypothetical protein KI387_026627, partial [Taxus chinensis]
TLWEGVEVHAEDVEPEQSVLPHLGKHVRETPSASDESSSHGERRVIGTYLNPPSDQTLALGFLDQGRSIVDPVGISGSDRSVPRRYNFSFPTSMAMHIPVFRGIFGQGASTQAFGLMSGSGTGYTS